MIMHVYIYRLKEPDKAREIADKLLTLRERIPYMRKMEVGIDFRHAQNSWDLVEICKFDCMEDFIQFGIDEYHAAIREYMSDKCSEGCKVDCEV